MPSHMYLSFLKHIKKIFKHIKPLSFSYIKLLLET